MDKDDVFIRLVLLEFLKWFVLNMIFIIEIGFLVKFNVGVGDLVFYW